MVRLYTKMLSWSQNQVQAERFPVSVCHKHGILLTRDLFETKPCEHVAVPWHHANPCKIRHLQRLLRFHGISPASWTSLWNLSRVDSISYVSICLYKWFPWIWRCKVTSVCSWQIHTNPLNLFNSTNTLISTSHPDLWGVTACTPGNLGADFGPNGKSTHGQTKQEAIVSSNVRSISGWKLKTGYHLQFIRVQWLNPWNNIWTSDSLLQTISIFFWMPQRCEGVIKLSVVSSHKEIKLYQISTKAPETPRPRLVENPWKTTVYLSLLKGLSFHIHKSQGFPSRMQSDLSDLKMSGLFSAQESKIAIWTSNSERIKVEPAFNGVDFLNEVSTMRKWLNLTILTIHEAPCSQMASSKLPSR